MISKIIQKNIFDIVFVIQDKLGITNYNLFLFVHIFHHVVIFFVPYLIILFNSNLLIMIINLSVIVLFQILFFIFKGCIMTRLEQKLEKNNIIIGDILLDILGINKTTNNRKLFTSFIWRSLIFLQLYKICVPNSILHF